MTRICLHHILHQILRKLISAGWHSVKAIFLLYDTLDGLLRGVRPKTGLGGHLGCTDARAIRFETSTVGDDGSSETMAFPVALPHQESRTSTPSPSDPYNMSVHDASRSSQDPGGHGVLLHSEAMNSITSGLSQTPRSRAASPVPSSRRRSRHHDRDVPGNSRVSHSPSPGSVASARPMGITAQTTIPSTNQMVYPITPSDIERYERNVVMYVLKVPKF